MSLFNPWVILGILIAIGSSFGGGVMKGKHDEFTRQQLEIAALNADARQKEQALVAAVQNQATQLQKVNQDAKLAQQKRNADIDSGAFKLRLPVKTPVCPVHASADAPVASGSDTGTASAELDPETAKSLIAITEEGDAAIRKLNACINLYNQTIEALKVKP